MSGQFSLDRIRKGRFRRSQWPKVSKIFTSISISPIFVVGPSEINSPMDESIEQLVYKGKVRLHKQGLRLKFIFIDGLEELGNLKNHIMERLRVIACKNNVAVVVTCRTDKPRNEVD